MKNHHAHATSTWNFESVSNLPIFNPSAMERIIGWAPADISIVIKATESKKSCAHEQSEYGRNTMQEWLEFLSDVFISFLRIDNRKIVQILWEQDDSSIVNQIEPYIEANEYYMEDNLPS